MKIVQIPKSILLHPSNYMQVEGKYDLLGCLILELFGVQIPDKTKFPSQLKMPLGRFVIDHRRTLLDSELTLQILRLNLYPLKEVIAPLNKILEPHKIQVVLV